MLRSCRVCGAALHEESPLEICAACVAPFALDGHAMEKTDAPPTSSFSAGREGQPGELIGPYKLLQKIGEGGCGVVYMAEQERPFHRRVALKIIKLGMDTRQVVARFEAERQALAMMDHPNITKVLDGGATKTGRPYFVMELVRGVRITDYCDEAQLATSQRIELFMDVCRAVQHAHQKGIIHRDLKPSNILVTINDGVAVPKIIDFGISKAIAGQQLTSKTVFTAFEQFIGTPAYMSPEQALMTSLDIDTRSDIYSLGVLLYELLTGKTPFDQEKLLAAGFDSMRRVIREEEPIRPSSKLSTFPHELLTTTAKRRSTQAPQLIHAMRGDLDWIVMKCLEKDRSRRYESASHLAVDLERHLRDEPIVARPPSKRYAARKWVHRHRTLFLASSSVLLTLLAGIAVSTAMYLRERVSRQRAANAEDVARDQAALAQDASEQSRQQLLRLQIANGTRLMERGDLIQSLPWFVEAFRTDQGHPENEDHHRLRLASVLQQCPRPLLLAHHSTLAANVRFSPDGQRLLTAAKDGTASIWEVATGKQLATETFPFNPDVWYIKSGFSTNGKRAFVEGDRSVIVWDLDVSPPRSRTIAPANGFQYGGGRTVAISPDGSIVATRTNDGVLDLWDAATGQHRIKLPGQHESVRAIHFAAAEMTTSWHTAMGDSNHPVLLAAGQMKTVQAWDAVTGILLGERELTDREDSPLASADWCEFSADGNLLFQAYDGTQNMLCRVWDVSSGRTLGDLTHGHRVHDLAFSPDAKSMATASQDGAVRSLNLETGQMRGAPWRHADWVMSIAMSTSGRRAVTGCRDGVARVWNVETGELSGPPLIHTSPIASVAFGPDEATVATACDDGSVRVWSLAAAPKWIWFGATPSAFASHELGEDWCNFYHDLHRGEIIPQPDGAYVLSLKEAPRFVPLPMDPPHQLLSMSDDGSQLLTSWAVSHLQRNYRLISAQTGQPAGPAVTLGTYGLANIGNLSGDGSRLALAEIVDMRSGQVLSQSLELNAKERIAEVSPDGSLIAVTTKERIHVINASDGHDRFQLMGQSGPEYVKRSHFSFDSQRIVTWGHSNQMDFAQVWTTNTGQPLGARLLHQGLIHSAAFSHDGRYVVTSGADRGVHIWDSITGQRVVTMAGAARAIESAVFGPDDRTIVGATNDDGFVWIWDARSGEPLIPPLEQGHFPGVGDMFQRAMLLDNGRILMAFNAEPRHWKMPADDRTLEQWRTIAGVISSQVAGEHGRLEPLPRDALESAWIAARAQQADEFTFSQARWTDWNLWRAEVEFQNRNFVSALPYLNTLIAEDPQRFRFRSMRAHVYESQERWQEMAADLRVAVEQAPHDLSCWQRLAAAELAAANGPGFSRAVAGIADQLHVGLALDQIVQAIQISCLGPGIDAATIEKLRATLRHFEGQDRYNKAEGMLAFREGRFERALEMLTKNSGGSVTRRLFLAMSHQALGHQDEARALIERDVQDRRYEPEVNWFQSLPAASGVYKALRQEADHMLGSDTRAHASSIIPK